ncbi:MAG: alpha/beta hydrolase [Pseudoxanthomonas sp.]
MPLPARCPVARQAGTPLPLLRSGLALLLLSLLGCRTADRLDPAQQALADAARQAGATELKAVAREDGGLQLIGKLGGDQFALVAPKDWNRQAMLFAHGYTQPGTPVEVPTDPIAKGKDANGTFRTPYSQGFLIGHSAYDKAGMDVSGAVENTHRLAGLVNALGSTRNYLVGSSMGGNIVIALLDRHPGDFAGAIANCGVVGDWPAELGWTNDVRAAYDYFTRGTQYALPGEKDITRSAMPSPSFGPLRMWKIRRMAKPLYALFDADKANPGGPESRIIDNIAAVADTHRDAASFGLPILISAFGMDDFNAVFGGQIFDNTARVYHSPHLDAAGNASLNADMQRVKADPAAVDRANAWIKASGRIGVPLLTLYNQTDSLVPSAMHEGMLREAVAAAGNEQWLLQRQVPAMTVPLPMSKLEGLAHCGFTPQHTTDAWNDLRRWVETGVKPAQ